MQKKRKSVFPGGVHPTDGSDKALSKDAAIKQYLPDTVTILSEQSFGGKCRLLVKPGDKVKAGQLIGEPEAFMAAPLHASMSGTVLDVKEVMNQGRAILACVIGRDEEEAEGSGAGQTGIAAAYRKEAADIRQISREEILAGLRDGGLTGMGGAGFPTHKKYETDKSIDTLLINGAECEPYLTLE